MGLCMVNVDAIAVPAFPDPDDNSDQPGWYYRGQQTVVSESGNVARNFLREDLRGKRKFPSQGWEHLMMHTLQSGAAIAVEGIIRQFFLKS